MDCKYDVLGGYVPSFIEHLEEARARLGVGAGPEASEEGMVIDNADGNEAAENSPAAPDTIFPDTPSLSLWTSTEQTAFFRALSVYSRWRPDLVAACVPTKSVWEVGLYLEALEQGAARLAMEEEEDEVDDREDDDSPREVAERNGKGKIKEQDDGNRDKDTDMDGSPSSSSSSGSDSDMDEDEDEDEDIPGAYKPYEPAHEVSEAWIDAEEVMASWVIHEDYLASLDKHANNDVDEGELEGVEREPPKRKRGRPRGSGKGRGRRRPPAGGKTEADSRSQSTPPLVQHSQTPERTHDLSTGPESSSGSRKRTLDSSDSPTHKRSKLVHERETLMGRLEDAHLLVLDGILREDEEAMRERNMSREGSVAEVRTHVANEGGLGSGDVVGVGASDERQVHQGNRERTGGCPSNAMIDPVLLALSGVTSGSAPTVPPAPTLDLPYEPSKPAPPANTSSQPIPSHQSPSTLSQLGASNMLTCPNTSNVVVPNPDPTRDPDPMLLSPRSRRRLQKRLYMRRRRALLHGDNVGSESALSTADKSKATNMEKLKPGKKAKAEQSDMPVAFASVPGSEAPSDVESEAAKEISTKTKGGLTLPYKLKAEFAALGVDAAYLRAQGMDLLHLGVLGRLMGLYASLECGTDGERETDETVSVQSIDAKLIQHLQTAMISFVTDVAHRAIVWKERELRLKKRSRAWRQGEQIAPSAIEHAVNAIGACHHSHKQYFRSLLLFYGLSDHGDTKPRNTSIKYRTASPLAAPSLPAHASDDDHPTGGPADSEAGAEDSDRVAPSPAPFVPHREIYTPLIRPPSACGINPLDCLSQTYMREVTRTQRGGSQDLEEEELISDETDEEELEAELREEDELDRRDMKMAGKLEQCLWDAIGYMDDSDSDILMLELSGTSK